VQAQNIVRLDQFVPFVNCLLNSEPRLRVRMQEYKHVLVDEVQDTDRGQYAFVELLTRKTNNIFFVGDPNQGIFEFRGADVCPPAHRSLIRFSARYLGAFWCKLCGWRSPAAGATCGHNV
jgi:superfamily I DNA/RNA helicase